MKLTEIKLGMLVKSAYRPEISEKQPGTVVGFNGCSFVVVADADNHVRFMLPENLEPAHYGCSLCKHAHKAFCDNPCAYCRGNTNLDSTLRDKLPDFWEKDDLYGDDEEETTRISRKDSELAAEIVLRYAETVSCMASACNSDIDTTELHELAERIRNGVCK